jgi:hypothetical protein
MSMETLAYLGLENGGAIITETVPGNGMIRYRTRIDDPHFWPVYTENEGIRSKTGYKTRAAALAGHQRIVRAFCRWQDARPDAAVRMGEE